MIEPFQASEIETPRDKEGIIGRGSYGAVRICRTSSIQCLAAKCFSAANSDNNLEAKKKRFRTEADVLQRIRHKNILTFYGMVTWQDSFAILTEYVNGGNLDELLHTRKFIRIPWPLRLRIAAELSDAISFLHMGYKPGKILVHCDIKPENILLSGDLTVKLADFGSVNLTLRTCASETTLNVAPNKQCTILYAAPEFLKNPQMSRSPEMDVYSYSMVLYELVSRRRVFENVQLNRSALIQVIIDINQRPDESTCNDLRSQLSSEDLLIFDKISGIMRKSWSGNPEERPKMRSAQGELWGELDKMDRVKIQQQAADVARQVVLKQPVFHDASWITLDQFSPPFMEPKTTLTRIPSLGWSLNEDDWKMLLNETNCFKIRAHAIESKNYKLTKNVNGMIVKNFESLTKGEEFKGFKIDQVMEILQLGGKQLSSSIFNAMIGWIQCDVTEREQHLESLFALVDLGDLSRKFITSVVAKENLIMNSHKCCQLLINDFIRRLDSSESSTLECLNPADSKALSLTTPPFTTAAVAVSRVAKQHVLTSSVGEPTLTTFSTIGAFSTESVLSKPSHSSPTSSPSNPLKIQSAKRTILPQHLTLTTSEDTTFEATPSITTQVSIGFSTVASSLTTPFVITSSLSRSPTTIPFKTKKAFSSSFTKPSMTNSSLAVSPSTLSTSVTKAHSASQVLRRASSLPTSPPLTTPRVTAPFSPVPSYIRTSVTNSTHTRPLETLPSYPVSPAKSSDLLSDETASSFSTLPLTDSSQIISHESISHSPMLLSKIPSNDTLHEAPTTHLLSPRTFPSRVMSRDTSSSFPMPSVSPSVLSNEAPSLMSPMELPSHELPRETALPYAVPPLASSAYTMSVVKDVSDAVSPSVASHFTMASFPVSSNTKPPVPPHIPSFSNAILLTRKPCHGKSSPSPFPKSSGITSQHTNSGVPTPQYARLHFMPPSLLRGTKSNEIPRVPKPHHVVQPK